MQRKLVWMISVDFEARGQLPVMYSAFIEYCEKNGTKWSSALAIYGSQEGLQFSYKKGLVQYSHWGGTSWN
jgi:hypothetical protein